MWLFLTSVGGRVQRGPKNGIFGVAKYIASEHQWWLRGKSIFHTNIHNGNESELIENTAQEWSVWALTEDHLVLSL